MRRGYASMPAQNGKGYWRRMLGFGAALALTLATETAVAFMYRAVFRLPWLLLLWVPLASLLTLPFVWLAFPRLPLPDIWVIALAELFVVVIEACCLYLAPRQRLRLAHAVALSLVMNSASFLLGLLV